MSYLNPHTHKLDDPPPITAAKEIEYRVGNHQPQNIYRGDQYIGVMFSPIDAAAVVNAMNQGLGECLCNTYDECHGECCGVGMCSCSITADGAE